MVVWQSGKNVIFNKVSEERKEKVGGGGGGGGGAVSGVGETPSTGLRHPSLE